MRTFVKVSITPSGVIEELTSNSLGGFHVAVPVTGLSTVPADFSAGDISGSYQEPTVVAIQGNAISNSSPALGDVLTWNGSSWTPQETSSGDNTFFLSNFSANNYYQGATNTMSGSDNFTAAAVVRQGLPLVGGARWIFACYRQFVNGGWAIGVDENRPIVSWTSGSTILQNFITTNANWSDLGLVSGKMSIHMLTYDRATTTISYYLNGQFIFSNTTADFTPNTAASPTIGTEWFAHAGAFDGGINGVAYTSAATFTARQALEHYIACTNSGTLVDSYPGFQNLYVVTSSTAPTILEDQIGSLDFFLTGTLGVSSSATSQLAWI